MSTDAEIIRKELSTPRAAAIAGVVFSLLLGASLVLVRISVPTNPSDAKQWLADSGRRHAVLVAVNLVPFAGIAFLWFIGVIRDRLGDREDLLRHCVSGQRPAIRGDAVRGSGGHREPGDRVSRWRRHLDRIVPDVALWREPRAHAADDLRDADGGRIHDHHDHSPSATA